MKQILLTILLLLSFESKAQFVVNIDTDGSYYRQWIFAHQPVIDRFHSDDRYYIYTNKLVLPSLSTDSSGTSVNRFVYALPNGIVRSAEIGNLQKASGSLPGILTSTDWSTFNDKQGAITLTTTGSGAATLVGNTLNIPTPASESFAVTTFASGTKAFNTAYQFTSRGDISISVSISCNLSLTGGQAGNIQLQVSPNGTTGWVTYATLPASNTGALTIGLNTTQVSGGQLTAPLQAGEYWRLVPANTTGTPTYTAGSGFEKIY